MCGRILSSVESATCFCWDKVAKERGNATPVNEVGASSTENRFLSGQGPADRVAHLSHSSARRFVGAPVKAQGGKGAGGLGCSRQDHRRSWKKRGSRRKNIAGVNERGGLGT